MPDVAAKANYSIELSNGIIPVHTYGKGKRLMIALHGFTYSGSVFEDWRMALGSTYKICAPDIPFHGEAKWQKKYVTDQEIIDLILAIAQQEGYTSFTLLGHSMGARFIICTAQQLQAHLDQVILLAPAGIGSYDRVANLFFQRIGEWALGLPKWFPWVVKTGHRLGWISNFHKRYAEVQLIPVSQRYQLFRVLNSLRYFDTSIRMTRSFWQAWEQQVLILLGRKDRLIPSPKVEAYFANCRNANVVYTDEGHELVTPAIAQVVAKWLVGNRES